MREKSKARPEPTRMQKLVGGTVLAMILFFVIVGIVAAIHGSNKPAYVQAPASQTSSTSGEDSSVDSSSSGSASTSSTPAQRQVEGTAKTLGAGNFTVGTDVAVGIYDVTAPAGQSGNFVVNSTGGTAVYNEIIGDPSQGDGDVSKIRVTLTKGEQIQISGLSGVTFTPVTAPFVTVYATTELYAGTFIVGQDIGAGRYVVTPASGESGNFYVYDSNGDNLVNEILGSDTSMGDDPSYTVTLNNGDMIQLSGIDSTTFTAQ